MEALELTEEQRAILANEILRLLKMADEYRTDAQSATSPWERGLVDGKAIASQSGAIRLGQLIGLVHTGMAETVEEEVPRLRHLAEEVVAPA
jgi:hypothetical protein